MEDQTGVKPVLGHGNISHDITALFSRETVPLNNFMTFTTRLAKTFLHLKDG